MLSAKDSIECAMPTYKVIDEDDAQIINRCGATGSIRRTCYILDGILHFFLAKNCSGGNSDHLKELLN